MTKAEEYTVKRIDKDTFELWHRDKRLATLTREEAWPVMIGRVRPDTIVFEQLDEATIQNRSDDE
jgi:hypothetical protein